MTAALFGFSADISRHPSTGRAPFLAPVWSLLDDLVQWVSNGFGATYSKPDHSKNATDLIAVRACQTGVSGTNHSKTQVKKPIFKTPPQRIVHPIRQGKVRALRVVRVMEAGQPSASSGRMVISGRMADVCAELDRLAAREALLH
jgi:hypothetical protein